MEKVQLEFKIPKADALARIKKQKEILVGEIGIELSNCFKEYKNSDEADLEKKLANVKVRLKDWDIQTKKILSEVIKTDSLLKEFDKDGSLNSPLNFIKVKSSLLNLFVEESAEQKDVRVKLPKITLGTAALFTVGTVKAAKWIAAHRKKDAENIVPNQVSEKPAKYLPQSNPSKEIAKPFKDCKWNEIKIQFVDGLNVKIWTKGIKPISADYRDMGFADLRKRDRGPVKHWELLRRAADNAGIIPWDDPDIDINVKNRKKDKQTISAILKAYFGIKEDPFFPYKSNKEYKLMFALLPE
jgi:hypothetical protein